MDQLDQMDYWVEELDLKAHPEGGYYRETYRSGLEYEGRSLSTHIYYLLPGDSFSRFHRLRYDEHWYFHYGSAMRMYFLRERGLEAHVLGLRPAEGESLSLLVPGGTIFGGEVLDKTSFTLVSCHMAPGFHFEDFELPAKKQLKENFPEHQSVIDKLT